MPTGFTAAVMEGRPIDLTTFVLTCARSRGVSVFLKDRDDFGPVPDACEPMSDYYPKAVAEAQRLLDEFLAMSPEQKAEHVKTMRDVMVARWESTIVAEEVENKRLEGMLKQVRTWKPPTEEHIGLHLFMVDQLTISMHDVDYVRQMVSANPPLTDPAEIEEHITNLEEALRRNLTNAKWSLEQETTRRTQADAWLKALHKSLPPINPPVQTPIPTT